MTILAFCGYSLLGLGPGSAVAFLVVAPNSFLVLVALTSACFWLVALVLAACLWRVFLPLGPAVWPYLLLILSVVALQEAARSLFWRLFLRMEDVLDQMAASQGRKRLMALDKLEIALGELSPLAAPPLAPSIADVPLPVDVAAGGLGFGALHTFVFFFALLAPAAGPATFYLPHCSQMPFFAAAALLSSSLLLFHTFSMPLAFHALSTGTWVQQCTVPILHAAASCSMLLNLSPLGCRVGVAASWLWTATVLGLLVKLVVEGKWGLGGGRAGAALQEASQGSAE